MKRCPNCGCLKKLDQFNKQTATKDGHQYECRQCSNEKSTKHSREVKGHLPMSENKECAQYLGIAVAERLVRHLFKDVVRMPNGNSGFDFICAHDKKIDVKSACITMVHKKNPRWVFHIYNNQIADYFLLIAFTKRSYLEPQHQWIIPGHVLNQHKTTASISPSTIEKWDKYRQPIEAAQICCNAIKDI